MLEKPPPEASRGGSGRQRGRIGCAAPAQEGAGAGQARARHTKKSGRHLLASKRMKFASIRDHQDPGSDSPDVPRAEGVARRLLCLALAAQ